MQAWQLQSSLLNASPWQKKAGQKLSAGLDAELRSRKGEVSFDILVNYAGIGRSVAMEEFRPEDGSGIAVFPESPDSRRIAGRPIGANGGFSMYEQGKKPTRLLGSAW
ncbi:hypothetical protein [Paenibacillus humicus]|uniref:hypothetical protein n=1 Tax=Paenibacillus humicus TaxID=412861 RepID=UPI003F17CDF3